MGEELVTVSAGGQTWTAFRRVMVQASLKEAARSFHLDIAAEASPGDAMAAFYAGSEVEILFNGELALRGYVDRYQPKISEHASAEIVVSGRSRSQDLIDSSAVHKTGRFENKDPEEIGQELDQAGVGIKTDQKLDKVPVYQITQGETVFRCLERLCRSQGVTMSGQPDGSILITKASSKRHAGGLFHPGNIKAADADHNWSGRHSKVIVRGQRPFGSGDDSLAIEAASEDATVGRHRPVIVVQDEDTDKPRAKKRAKNRRDKEAGNALKAHVTVQGFRDDDGTLWTPGFLVWTESRFLALAQDMVIESVKFEQDRKNGSIAVLGLTDPRAHGGKTKGGKSGKDWSTDAGEDE
jgi:prophage tail gpP-like protein